MTIKTETYLNNIELIAGDIMSSKVKQIESALSNLINHYEHEHNITGDSSLHSFAKAINDICTSLNVDIKQIIDCNRRVAGSCLKNVLPSMEDTKCNTELNSNILLNKISNLEFNQSVTNNQIKQLWESYKKLDKLEKLIGLNE
jgi:hypothetical protein